MGHFRGEGNPFFGKKHSLASRKKISANHGMRGRDAFQIWRERFGDDEAERMKKELLAQRSKLLSGPLNPQWGKTHSSEWRASHSQRMTGSNNPNFGKDWVWVRRENQTKRVLRESLQSFLEDGWKLGRKAA
jgi:hypothetical protein